MASFLIAFVSSSVCVGIFSLSVGISNFPFLFCISNRTLVQISSRSLFMLVVLEYSPKSKLLYFLYSSGFPIFQVGLFS